MVIQSSVYENTFSLLLVYSLTADNYCLPLCVVEKLSIMIGPFILFLSLSQCKTALLFGLPDE